MAVYEDLDRVLAVGTWRELVPMLEAAADADTREEVRRWYRKRRAHWTKRSGWDWAGADDRSACLRALAVALAPPEQAAGWLSQLQLGWRRNGGPADRFLVDLASGRGREWCVSFFEAASSPTGSKDEDGPAWIAHLALPLIAAEMAEVPRGPLYGKSWASHYASGAAEYKWAVYRNKHPKLYGGVGPLPQGKLVDQLRDDPALTEGLLAALSSPGAIGILENCTAANWELGPAVAELVREGRLDRRRVVDEALAALTRQDTAATQKGIAKLLTALDLGGDDVAGRMPLIQGLLATGRGSVAAALLPAAIEAAQPNDLVDLAGTIFTRPEKAQRSRLVRAVTAKDAVERWGREAVTRSLQLAAEVPDQAVATKAVKALADLGMTITSLNPTPMDGLWAPPPSVPEARSTEPFEANERGMTAALSRISTAGTAAGAAVFWDAVVRWAARDVGALRAWAESARQGLDANIEPPTALRAALSAGGTPERNRALCDTVAGDRAGVATLSLPVVQEMFAAETTLRLGTIPFLLSTPTRQNGTVEFDTLLDRLHAYRRTPVGSTDLLLALLRLQPVDAQRAGELGDISLPLWPPSATRAGLTQRRKPSGHAGEMVRRWVADGGLPRLIVRHDGANVHVDPVRLPIPLGMLPGIPTDLFAGHRSGVDDEYYEWWLTIETGFGIAPAWPDLLAAKMQLRFDQSARFPPRWLPPMAHAPTPGLAVQHAIAATLGHAAEDCRLLAVDAALTLMGRGFWDVGSYTTCCEHMLADGKLWLGRLAHAWEQLILGGGLQLLWPTALAVLDAASSTARNPSGLAALLAMLRRYVAAVPNPEVPGSVICLAESRRSSKSRMEAQAFVTTANQVGSS